MNTPTQSTMAPETTAPPAPSTRYRPARPRDGDAPGIDTAGQWLGEAVESAREAPRESAKAHGLPSILSCAAKMRFFTVSLLVHTVLVILVGGVVLFKKVAAPPDFAAGDGELVQLGDDTSQAPPEAPAPPDIPQFQAPAAQLASPNLDVVTAATELATFQVNASPAKTAINDQIGVQPGERERIGERLAGLAGGGMKGGFFGTRASKENKGIGLTGDLYDAKQTRSRTPTNIDVRHFGALISKFVNEGWKDSLLSDFYKAPNTLITTQIFIPNMPATAGPKAFDVEKEVQPSRWLVHYRGKISPPRDGNYRFVGAGDDYLVVRLNNKVVLDHGFGKATAWKPEAYYNYGYTRVPHGFARGDQFHAVAGKYDDLEILISESPGGYVFFCLMIEDQDKEYRKDAKGNPILPVFRLADGPMPELEKGQTLPPHDPDAPIWKSQPFRGSSFSQFFGSK